MDHRPAAMGVALPAGRHTRLAADAAPRIDEQRRGSHPSPVPLPRGALGGRSSVTGPGGSLSPGGTGGGSTGSTAAPRSTRHAQTLNSGILEVGSRASTVRMLAAADPAQW